MAFLAFLTAFLSGGANLAGGARDRAHAVRARVLFRERVDLVAVASPEAGANLRAEE